MSVLLVSELKTMFVNDLTQKANNPTPLNDLKHNSEKVSLYFQSVGNRRKFFTVYTPSGLEILASSIQDFDPKTNDFATCVLAGDHTTDVYGMISNVDIVNSTYEMMYGKEKKHIFKLLSDSELNSLHIDSRRSDYVHNINLLLTNAFVHALKTVHEVQEFIASKIIFSKSGCVATVNIENNTDMGQYIIENFDENQIRCLVNKLFPQNPSVRISRGERTNGIYINVFSAPSDN